MRLHRHTCAHPDGRARLFSPPTGPPPRAIPLPPPGTHFALSKPEALVAGLPAVCRNLALSDALLVRPGFQPTRTASRATSLEERKMTPSAHAQILAHIVVLAVAMGCASSGFASPASVRAAAPSHDRAVTRVPMLFAQASAADPKTGESAARDACENAARVREAHQL